MPSCWCFMIWMVACILHPQEYHSQFELQQLYSQWQQYEGRVLHWDGSWGWGGWGSGGPERLTGMRSDSSSGSSRRSPSSSSGSSSSTRSSRISSESSSSVSAPGSSSSSGSSGDGEDGCVGSSGGGYGRATHRWLLRVRLWGPAWAASDRDEALEAQVTGLMYQIHTCFGFYAC